VDANEIGHYILHSEVEKAIKHMRDQKATGGDDEAGNVLKLLGENGLKLMTHRSTAHTKLESGSRI
jgi:hypothetical protein